MGLILRMAVAIAITVYCLYKWGEHWYQTGLSDGYLRSIRSLCEGHMWVEGRKLMFDGEDGIFYDREKGEFVTELDMDKLEFVED